MRWRDLGEEPCSIARTVSVIGDRWTLMVLRECFRGVRRFETFQSRLGIARAVLTERLQGLVEAGVLRQEPYQQRPLRQEYRLTKRGLDLHPVMLAIAHWGDVHMAPGGRRPLLYRHCGCGQVFDPLLACSACGEPVTARDVAMEPGPGAGERGARTG